MRKILSVLLTLLMTAAVFSGVFSAVSPTPGDTNGDGAIDNKDVVTLFRFVSGNKAGAVEENCDYNCDGEINNKDVTTLFRSVSSGKPVEETKKDPADVKIGGVPLTDFAVVVAADAPSGVKNAAADLIRLVDFAAGVELPLKTADEAPDHSVILGETSLDNDKIVSARAKVKDDGYALVESDGNLYISGVIARGTMNGVYDFLQDYLGMRFYSDTFTYVRKDYVKDVPAGQKTVFNPVFPGRYNWTVSAEKNNQRYAKRTKSTSIKYAGSHNLGSLSKTGDGVSAQPCLSDPEVFENVFNSLCKQIDKNPTKTLFHINQNDGGKFCTCAECTAKNETAGGTAMGSLLVFINDIAAAVKEKYPDRDIDILTYAYKETTIAPDPDFVKPADNVVIVLCMMDSSCFTHAYNDPTCEHNKKAYENMVNWSKICNKFAVYDYSYNFASTVSSVGPNLDILWDNFQAFKACGCIGLLFEGDHMSETGEFAELRNYLINRLMWDPDITKKEYNKMREEFMEDYYGEAAPYISEYIDLLNATSQRPLTEWNGHTSVYTDPKVFYAPVVNGEKDYTVIEKCRELWDKAEACMLTDEQFAHVEKSSIHYYDFYSRFGGDYLSKRRAASKYQALCDKYTYDYDADLPDTGDTDLSPEVPSDGLSLKAYPDGSGLYVCDRGTFEDGMLVIPATQNGKKVTSVGKSAFARATNLVEVHVPEGITYIGAYAFRGCRNLKTVYLPVSLKTLGFAAFGITGDEHYGSDKLTDVYYAGTRQTWQKLYNANNGTWSLLKNCTVHCSDGDIVISAE